MDISIPMQTRMKEDSSMIDLSLDYHAHILPGCDHGSSSVDMSLKQMDMAKRAYRRFVQRPIFTHIKRACRHLSKGGDKPQTTCGHKSRQMLLVFC